MLANRFRRPIFACFGSWDLRARIRREVLGPSMNELQRVPEAHGSDICSKQHLNVERSEVT